MRFKFCIIMKLSIFIAIGRAFAILIAFRMEWVLSNRKSLEFSLQVWRWDKHSGKIQVITSWRRLNVKDRMLLWYFKQVSWQYKTTKIIKLGSGEIVYWHFLIFQCTWVGYHVPMDISTALLLHIKHRIQNRRGCRSLLWDTLLEMTGYLYT